MVDLEIFTAIAFTDKSFDLKKDIVNIQLFGKDQ